MGFLIIQPPPYWDRKIKLGCVGLHFFCMQMPILFILSSVLIAQFPWKQFLCTMWFSLIFLFSTWFKNLKPPPPKCLSSKEHIFTKNNSKNINSFNVKCKPTAHTSRNFFIAKVFHDNLVKVGKCVLFLVVFECLSFTLN